MSEAKGLNAGASAAELSDDGSVLTVTAPLSIRRRGGRKRIMTPAGEPDWALPRRQVDSALVKALARAFRWKRLIERDNYHSISDLAVAEKISEAYVRRLLRLTLLAPPLIEQMLDGRQSERVQLEDLRGELPADWSTQAQHLQKV